MFRRDLVSDWMGNGGWEGGFHALSLRVHADKQLGEPAITCSPTATRPLIVIEINYDLLCYVLIKFLLYIGRAEHTQQRTK